MKALIFDVDGTPADTEDLHRQAFNAAFAEAGLDWHREEARNRALLPSPEPEHWWRFGFPPTR